MAKIIVHGGDYKGHGSLMFGVLILPSNGSQPKKYLTSEIEAVETATEESVKRVGGTIGWAIVGGLALGGVGLLAGLLAGGRGKEVTFVARFKDGKKILATTDVGTFNKLQAATYL